MATIDEILNPARVTAQQDAPAVPQAQAETQQQATIKRAPAEPNALPPVKAPAPAPAQAQTQATVQGSHSKGEFVVPTVQAPPQAQAQVQQPATVQGSYTGPNVLPTVQAPPQAQAQTLQQIREQQAAEEAQAQGQTPAPPQGLKGREQGKSPDKVSTYAELIEKYAPKPKTAEELAELEKKNRRKQIINSIGEGLSALSNVYFTTQYAPSMYKAKDNAVERTKTNYDKMLADNKATALQYIQMKLAEQKAEDAQKAAEVEAARKAKADETAANQWQLTFNEGQRKTNLDNQYRYDKLAHDAEEGEKNRQSQERRTKTQAGATMQAAKTRAEATTQAAQTRASSSSRSGSGSSSNTPYVFSDGKNTVGIHPKVWETSSQMVLDILKQEGIGKGTDSDRSYQKRMNKMTPAQQAAFVQENWTKSENAKQLMLLLSQLNPNDVESVLAEAEKAAAQGTEDDPEAGWEDWVGDSENEIPEWTPDK